MEDRKHDEVTCPVIRRRALRIDFLLVAANVIEKDAILNVFKLPFTFQEDRLQYRWGELAIQGRDGFSVTVALIWLRDNTGTNAAMHNALQAVPLLRPSYLIDVGIVAGASNRETKVALGDVIIANIIHHGATGKTEELRDGRPIHQPSVHLLSAAEDAGLQENWKTKVMEAYEKPSMASGGTKTEQKYHFAELVSADKMAVPDEEYVKLNQDKYPNAAAFEMEAGAIGNVLHDLNDIVHPPGFLCVKAISDMVTNGDISSTLFDRDERVDKGSHERETWRPFAAYTAAIFVRELIHGLPTDYLRPAYHARIWPGNCRPASVHCHSGSIAIYGNVEPKNYSELSANILTDLSGQNGHTTFFTVCAFSPSVLWEVVAAAGGKDPNTVSLKTQYEFATTNFSHFARFIDYANNHRESSFRILLLDGRKPKKDEWSLFLLLNGNLDPRLDKPSWDEGVPCWVIERNELRNKTPSERFLTDYVILGDEILLDYYQESGVLCVSELMRHQCRDYYLSLRDNFHETREHESSKFVPLSVKHKHIFDKVSEVMQ